MSEKLVGTMPSKTSLKGKIYPRGDDGGYYTIQVSQDDTASMRLSFTASEEGMEAIEDQVIELPQGPKGEKGDTGAVGPQGVQGNEGKPGRNGADGYTPVRGVDYWTEEDKAEIKSYVDEAILGGEW